MKAQNPFQRVQSNNPGRSLFDLSYDKKFTCDMGQLIPVVCDEAVPGDVWDISNGIVIRMQPMVAPIMHQVDVRVDYFFVPYRLLWSEWEDFITGGIDGNNASVIPRVSDVGTVTLGSLWDYFGFPVDVHPVGAQPIIFPWRAYNTVFNEYYRDETLDAKTDIDNSSVLKCRWEKDYFTSALPWQQRGTAPALPISGTTAAVWDDTAFNTAAASTEKILSVEGANNTDHKIHTALSTYARDNLKGALNDNTVDLSSATTFDIADLRLAFAIQKWMERNARCGARYTEFLMGHFGVAPRDDRLQRPEYIGGSRSPMIISEVLQTGSTDTESPQGNMAGHGLSADGRSIGRYHVLEYGIILGVMYVRPKTAYQQGVDRQWLRRSRYDFYHPEFANLSEQAIEMAEIYARGTESENRTIFGYQGRYDEMRVKRSMVCGQMRNTFAYWHLGRIFGSVPALNSNFIECLPDKRIFAVPSEPGLIVNFHNGLRVVRPLPIQNNPGLIDHDY